MTRHWLCLLATVWPGLAAAEPPPALLPSCVEGHGREAGKSAPLLAALDQTPPPAKGRKTR